MRPSHTGLVSAPQVRCVAHAHLATSPLVSMLLTEERCILTRPSACSRSAQQLPELRIVLKPGVLCHKGPSWGSNGALGREHADAYMKTMAKML